MSKELGRRFTLNLDHIERVKWYAPHIRHVVLDICCSTSSEPTSTPGGIMQGAQMCTSNMHCMQQLLHWMMLGGLCCREMHAYFQSCTTPCTGMQVTCKGSRLSCQRIFGRMRPRAWNLSSWRAVISGQPVRGESLFACPFAKGPALPRHA